MIVGIGVDVVDIERFGRQLERTPGLRDRLFVPAERELNTRSLAARFAAKEAVAKVLGAPAGMNWQDCWIGLDQNGPTSRSRAPCWPWRSPRASNAGTCR